MIIKPMLAGKGTFKDLPKILKKHNDLLLSRKIDGIRCLYIDGIPQSRSGKTHRNIHIQSMFKELYDILGDMIILDGELMNTTDGTTGKNFSANTEHIMSIKNKPTNLKYFIFDVVDDTMAANERYQVMKKLKLPDWCVVLEKIRIEQATEEQISDYYLSFIDEGYEGLIFQDTESTYKHNRSTLNEAKLIKLKPEEDTEAIIVGVNRLYTNNNTKEINELGYSQRSTKKEGLSSEDLVGSFTCKTIKSQYFEEGISFSVGSGLTMKQREDFWDIKD